MSLDDLAAANLGQAASTVGRWRARCLADESGLALVLALIVVAALSDSTASMIMLVTSNQTAVGRDRQEERAFNMAEAGLNEAVSYLSTQNTLLISSVSPTDFSLDNGNRPVVGDEDGDHPDGRHVDALLQSHLRERVAKGLGAARGKQVRHQHPLVGRLGQGFLHRRQVHAAQVMSGASWI